jgi:arsenite-transporting ATPase
MHFTTPLMHLHDSQETKVILVTLAETTPVLEAAEMQADLERAQIHPSAVPWPTPMPVLRRIVLIQTFRRHAAGEHLSRATLTKHSPTMA